MSVEKFNNWFKRFGEFQIKNRAWFLVAIAALTIFGAAGLTKFKTDNSDDGWFDDSEEVKVNEDRFKDVFGGDDAVMVLVEADDVFDPDVLDAIDRLGKRLESEVPYADELTSLTNLSISKGTEDGFEIVNPFEDGIPTDPEELKEKKDFILSRKSIVNQLVSEDATETWVILDLNHYETEEQTYIGKFAYDIVKSDEFKSDKYTLKGTGMAYTEYEEDIVTGKECATRIIIGFFIMILCLLLFVRSLRGLIVPIIATVAGIVSVMGYSSWFGVAANSTMLALPVLLGMALSVGYSIHYINEFRLHFRTTGKRYDSVVKAVQETGWPILFTVITTMASMISFMTVGIGELKWVGGICASIVFATYAYVIILIPIFMSFGKDKKIDKAAVEKIREKENAEYVPTKADRFFENLGLWVAKKRWWIVGISCAIIVASIPGIFKITVNMDYMEMMGKKIPYVRELQSILDAQIGSQYNYNIMIEFNDEDAFKDPENMKRLDELEKEIGKLNLTRWTNEEPRITSVTDIVKELNSCLNEDDDAFYCIPDNQELLTQELFLYEISGGDNLYNWLNPDYSTSFIHVELNGYDANLIVEDIANAKAMAQKVFPEAKCSIIGIVVNYAAMNEKLVKGELKSFLFSFVIIAIMMIIAFSSITTGLIGMIPNLAPVIFIGAIMGYFKMSLDMITMTVMPMILGIAVDDTIHFTNRTKLEFERTGSYSESLKITFREIGKTLGMTTFILCSMFAVFCFSPMGALCRIGVLTIVGLGSALIADYTLTPVLIYITKPFGKERK